MLLFVSMMMIFVGIADASEKHPQLLISWGIDINKGILRKVFTSTNFKKKDAKEYIRKKGLSKNKMIKYLAEKYEGESFHIKIDANDSAFFYKTRPYVYLVSIGPNGKVLSLHNRILSIIGKCHLKKLSTDQYHEIDKVLHDDDIIEEVGEKLDLVREKMVENLDLAIYRGEKLEELAVEAENLEKEAKKFEKKAIEVRRDQQCCCGSKICGPCLDCCPNYSCNFPCTIL